MFRSGTTLLEHVLAAHDQVTPGGEIDAILRMVYDSPWPACISEASSDSLTGHAEGYLSMLESRFGTDSHRVTDKMPSNYLHLGLVHHLFPHAALIHITRDPMDTCLSNFKNNFNIEVPYAYDLEELGGYYPTYAELVDHWKAVLPGFIYDVQYEELVSDPKRRIGDLLDHCGLPFDDACLNFHKTKRVVQTASMYQVRQPIYTTSVGSKAHYQDKLKPLNEALG